MCVLPNLLFEMISYLKTCIEMSNKCKLFTVKLNYLHIYVRLGRCGRGFHNQHCFDQLTVDRVN